MAVEVGEGREGLRRGHGHDDTMIPIQLEHDPEGDGQFA
jgi:hypothetical protein